MQLIQDKRNSVFLVGFFTTIVVIPGLLDAVNLPKLFLIILGSGVIIGLFWNELRVEVLSGQKTLIVILGIFTFALFLTAVLSPQSGFRSLVGTWGRNNGFLTYFCLTIILFVLALQKSRHLLEISIKFLSILGIFSSIYGFLQSRESDPITWSNSGNKIILTLGNSNFASALMALTAIACLVYFAKTRSVFQKILLFVFFFIQIYLIYKSDAVQGFITVFFGSTLFIGFLLTFSEAQLFRKISIMWWISLFVIGMISILSLFKLGPLAHLMKPYLFSFRDRYYHWVAAINMLEDHPFFGVGMDSFGDFYRRYRVQEAIDARGTASFGTNNAHNTFLQFGATGGLILLVAYVTLILFIAYRSIVAIKITPDRNLAAGVFSIWITFQVQSLVSIDQIGLVIWGWILGGCLVSASYHFADEMHEVQKRPLKVKRIRPKVQKLNRINILVMSVGLIPALFFTPILANEFILRTKIVSLVSTSTASDIKSKSMEVLSLAEKSSQPEVRLQAVNYLVQVSLYNEALQLAKMNNLQFPDSFESWDTTARIYEGLGDNERAIYPRQRSVALDPLNLEIKKILETDLEKN